MAYFSDRDLHGMLLFSALALIGVACLLAFKPRADRLAVEQYEQLMEQRGSLSSDTLLLHEFDPNTVDYATLRAMHLTRFEAVSLLRYRATGKVFRIPEDVALCYGISDSLYALLAPYIRIDQEFAYKPRTYDSLPKRTFPSRVETAVLAVEPFRIDTVGVRYLRAIGALSKRQAEAFVRWRNLSGIRDMEELRACYVVSDSVASALEPYIIFPERDVHPVEQPVELNRADSAALRRVVGIGEKTVSAILRYRARLGGFVRVEQLAEVQGVTESNYEKILKQISVDPYEITKIDINFAPPDRLAEHPYVTAKMLRKLLKQRQLKGGWRNTRELIDDHICTSEEAARLAPYLDFGHPSTPCK